jgi:hypothetical protein
MLEFTVLFSAFFGVILLSNKQKSLIFRVVGSLSIPISIIYFFFTDDISRYISLIPLSFVISILVVKEIKNHKFIVSFTALRLLYENSFRKIIIILIYILLVVSIVSLYSTQNIIPDYIGLQLTFASTAHKYDEFFLSLNLLTTLLFFLGVIQVSGKKINVKSYLLFVTFFLFFIHSIAGYRIQLIRSIAYFQGLLIISAIIGLKGLKLVPYSKFVFGLGLVLVCFNNYPTKYQKTSVMYGSTFTRFNWYKEPYIPKESTFLDFHGAFKSAKETGLPIYALTASTLTHSRFYEVELSQDYVNRSIWVITEPIEPTVGKYLDNYANAVFVVDKQGFDWLSDQGLAMILLERAQPVMFSGEIYVFMPPEGFP